MPFFIAHTLNLLEEHFAGLSFAPRSVLCTGFPELATLSFVQDAHVVNSGLWPHCQIIHPLDALPFSEPFVDLVIAAGDLHWTNDLPGALLQLRQCLMPGGLFIGMMPGGKSLYELRDVLSRTEAHYYNGTSPHISPFIDASDGAMLLQRAGFVMPVADSDIVTLAYTGLDRLYQDIRTSGNGNALYERNHKPLSKSFWQTVEHTYRSDYSGTGDRLSVTMEVITLSGRV